MESPAPTRQMPVAIVTGASGGIGLACAMALAASAEPCEIALQFNSNEAAAKACADEISNKFGGRVVTFQADLAQSGAADKLVDATARRLGPPSILIHAAGQLLEKPITFTKSEEWDALFEVHVYAAAALTKALARHLRKTERGRIVYIGSLAGRMGLGNGAAYAAAKGALDGLCKSFALEAARWKTTVNTIAPGFVETHMTVHHDGPRHESNVLGVPLRRYGKPEEVGALAAFLCSARAGYITGQTIVMDGGMSLG